MSIKVSAGRDMVVDETEYVIDVPETRLGSALVGTCEQVVENLMKIVILVSFLGRAKDVTYLLVCKRSSL